ncbi:MAG TPA: hypothetical protein VKB06_00795 [Nitrososphaera sp.]|nr:hypothetical protein [Nitrososphaera sp.]
MTKILNNNSKKRIDEQRNTYYLVYFLLTTSLKVSNLASSASSGISLGSPITLSPNTAASSQSASVSQPNVNTGSNNGPTQTNR